MRPGNSPRPPFLNNETAAQLVGNAIAFIFVIPLIIHVAHDGAEIVIGDVVCTWDEELSRYNISGPDETILSTASTKEELVTQLVRHIAQARAEVFIEARMLKSRGGDS